MSRSTTPPHLILILLLLLLLLSAAAAAQHTDEPYPDPTVHGQIPSRRRESLLRNDNNDDHDHDAPAYTPIATPAPDQDAGLASKGYYQTTYYKCQTAGAGGGAGGGGPDVRCGWHVPLLKAEGNRSVNVGVAVAVVLAAAGVFTAGML